jgi:hypothetical protein
MEAAMVGAPVGGACGHPVDGNADGCARHMDIVNIARPTVGTQLRSTFTLTPDRDTVPRHTLGMGHTPVLAERE